eukprot:gene9201-16875_t
MVFHFILAILVVVHGENIPLEPGGDFKVWDTQEDYGDGVEVDEIQMIMENNAEKIRVGHSHREYPNEFHLNLNYANLTVLLKVKANDVMMGVKPKLIYYDNNGKRIVDDDHDDGCCYYQGYDVNTPNTSVAISVCEDGMDGVIMMGDRQLVIKPSKKKMYMRESADRFTLGPHVLKESLAQKEEKLKLDYVHIPEIDQNMHNSSQRIRRNAQLTETKYVEVYAINDKSYYLWLGGNVDENLKRMKKILNIVDSLYHPHNIRIVFMALEVWSDSDKIYMGRNIEDALSRLYDYRQHNVMKRNPNDNTMLVSQIEFDGPAIGVAPMSAMCTERYSTNVNQDLSWDYSLVAGTIAHEMGHNFRMDHDGDSCRCQSTRGKCLMSPYAQNPTPLYFSECSESYLNNFLENKLGACLMNIPDLESAHYNGANTCGNNKLDPGEECDCGEERFCLNPCCNAKTCKLTSGSQCYTGMCCNNCKLKLRDTTCRPADNPCDIAEKCDGENGKCPENLFLQNGKACEHLDSDGYCYEGRCQSLTTQCRYAWGAATIQGEGKCFDLNTRGDKYGNCGTSGNYYVRCSSANRNCGKLFCRNGPSGFPVIGRSKGRQVVSFKSGGRAYNCLAGNAELGYTHENPFLAFTGVKCGEGFVCKNTKCVPVSEIQGPDCPGNCNRHGVCTQKGTCACDPGYVPPNCAKETVTTTKAPLSGNTEVPSRESSRSSQLATSWTLLFGLIVFSLNVQLRTHSSQ